MKKSGGGGGVGVKNKKIKKINEKKIKYMI